MIKILFDEKTLFITIRDNFDFLELKSVHEIKIRTENNTMLTDIIIKEYHGYVTHTVKSLCWKYFNTDREIYMDDVIQTFYLKIIESNKTADEINHIKGYIFKIIYNTIYDLKNKANKIITTPLLNDNNEVISEIYPTLSKSENEISQIISIEEINKCIKTTVSEMKPVKRIIFELIAVKNKTQTETAVILKKNQGTISEHWNNIKKELRLKIKNEFPDIEYDF